MHNRYIKFSNNIKKILQQKLFSVGNIPKCHFLVLPFWYLLRPLGRKTTYRDVRRIKPLRQTNGFFPVVAARFPAACAAFRPHPAPTPLPALIALPDTLSRRNCAVVAARFPAAYAAFRPHPAPTRARAADAEVRKSRAHT